MEHTVGGIPLGPPEQRLNLPTCLLPSRTHTHSDRKNILQHSLSLSLKHKKPVVLLHRLEPPKETGFRQKAVMQDILLVYKLLANVEISLFTYC